MAFLNAIAKMFARQNNDLPNDPEHAVTLEDMGYKVNEQGQFVSIDSPQHFFRQFTTDNERVNEVNRGSMNHHARGVVNKRLLKEGVVKLFLWGDSGVSWSQEAPEQNTPYTKIYATEPQVLKEEKDVIVVIGEHSQDLGIWAYRALMGEGGLNEGSAQGLAKKLRGLSFDGFPDQCDSPAGGRKDLVEVMADENHATPGLILLNPGQLIYSPDFHDCMTQKTWMARPRTSAVEAAVKIDVVSCESPRIILCTPLLNFSQAYNRIPGHQTPYEHVVTVFDHLIPQLVNSDVRLWIVGIADGAENFIYYMDSKLAADPKAVIGGLVSGMAFMEPTHDPAKLQSDAMKVFLHSHGKCWIKSSKLMGTWINAPGAMKRIKMPGEEDQEISTPRKESANRAEVDDDLGADAESWLISKPERETNTMETIVEEPEEVHEDETDQGDKPLTATHPTTASGSKRSSTGSDKRKSVSSNSSSLIHASQELADSPPLHRSVQSLKSADSDSPSSPTRKLDNLSLSTLPEEDSEAELGPMSGSYDYDANTVSCPTYSGGVDIDEMIWPKVMDEVLDFFKSLAEEENMRVETAKLGGA